MREIKWFLEAACASGNLRGVPFMERPVPQQQSICVGCPVQAECLETAMTTPELHFTWGGATEAERTLWRGDPEAYRPGDTAADVRARLEEASL